MSTAFTNYLTGQGTAVLRDYQHANRLYVTDTYAKAPKVGFSYFITFKINESTVVDKTWVETKGSRDVGLLAKRADLPKFTISNETLNQYNRKTIVQSKITYSPITIELHDDNSDITHNLWVNYFKHYFADGNYGDSSVGKTYNNSGAGAFTDTKYGTKDYTYGLYANKQTPAFFNAIDIYVLHQGEFTQYTLVNPKITEWAHDSVDQSDGAKVLKNRLSIAYENVIYKEGRIIPGQEPEAWTSIYYDKTPSPLAVAGNPKNPYDLMGAKRVGGAFKNPNPLLDIGMILAKNYVNKNGAGKLGPVGYNIASGALGALGSTAPGKYASPAVTGEQPGIFNLPGGVGINIFKGLNTSVDGKVRANPAAIIFPPRG
jgi:hypothetical protein